MKFFESILGMVAPHNCLVCGVEGRLVCDSCRVIAFESVPSRCFSCRRVTDNYQVCEKCRKSTPLKHVWVANELDGHAKELVYKLKFEQIREAAKIIAEAINERLPYIPEAVIVPVPTATTRVRQRGFDHAELVAYELSRLTGHACVHLLARTTQHRQVGARKSIRQNQMHDAFRVRSDYLAKGAKIVLVDDVVTTGATISAAAKVLRKAGAKQVDAVVFAQKD